MTPFQLQLINIIQMIPSGRVMSYGDVALYMGTPRAARMVGWLLRGLEGEVDMPWWRVINSTGRITIKGNKFNTPPVQKTLLQAEGIVVNNDLTIDIQKYRYTPTQTDLKKMSLPHDYLTEVYKKKLI